MKKKRVVVIGGGASGMLASIAAALSGYDVHVLEKNEKLGKKLYITGKGRCNLTNNCAVEDLVKHVVTNPKFLYSSFYRFSNQDMIELLETAGLKLKTERGNRVFPASDKSSDVIRTLSRLMERYGVKVHLHCEVLEIEIQENQVKGVIYQEKGQKKRMEVDRVIVATGGISYPSTGSTGDGYKFARSAGHQVTDLMPSLVPLETQEEWCARLMGLSLKNVQLRFCSGKKTLYDGFGEMLFTHFGISGPLVLTGSSYVTSFLQKGKKVEAHLDLKPALTSEQLDARLLREIDGNHNRQFRNGLSKLFPAKLIPVMVELSGIDPSQKMNAITREERLHFVELIKNLKMTIVGTRDFDEAIITKGGVNVKEINSSTMESKKVKGLYFAGEVLDVDAVTGGFNLQIAWSTGWTAGSAQFE